MLASIWSFLGLAEETPPPTTITCLRVPADGSPIHLLRLTTTPTSDNVDCFLFHIPDLRQYWNTNDAWNWRDIESFELEKQVRPICNGRYYVFYSFAMDDLPENPHVPKLLNPGEHVMHYGDVFVVKIASCEHDSQGWALYEDVPKELLELLPQR